VINNVKREREWNANRCYESSDIFAQKSVTQFWRCEKQYT